MSDYLNVYFKYLNLTVNVCVLYDEIKKLFYTLYEEYARIYGQSLNINFGQSETHSFEAPSSRIGKG